MKVIIRTYVSANKLTAIRTYEWKNSVYMVITMSMSITYIQLIQPFPALTRFPHFPTQVF